MQIRHHELIATDTEDEDIRVYLFEVLSVTAKLRNDLARGFLKTNDAKVLLVLTSDYEDIEFVYLKRSDLQKTKRKGLSLKITIRPIPLTVNRLNPSPVSLRVQAFKLASLFAALDWLETDEETPITLAGQAIAENWRLSAHRLLEQLDHSGEAVQEKRHQDRLLNAVRQSGANGVAMRDLYRKLNLPAGEASIFPFIVSISISTHVDLQHANYLNSTYCTGTSQTNIFTLFRGVVRTYRSVVG